MKKVAVVIPIYRLPLTDDESKSLCSICSVLHDRDLFVVKPSTLDITEVLTIYPQLNCKDFDPQFFQGIKGYNRLMTSSLFYSAFDDYKYILIAQLDTYFFFDDLDRWCDKGYDYVGAPWLKRKVNCYPPMSWIKKINDMVRKRKGLYSKIALYNKVGNGGLSLRKTASHKKICRTQEDKIKALNLIGVKGQPEDVFWATQETFAYPTALEALRFSFDKYPALCYRLNNNQLPMGCHGWNSRKMRPFWKRIF